MVGDDWETEEARHGKYSGVLVNYARLKGGPPLTLLLLLVCRDLPVCVAIGYVHWFITRL